MRRIDEPKIVDWAVSAMTLTLEIELELVK